ncbi:dual specificity protein phosphatase family protein [Citreicella sp. C3M06]|uniref:dual specificity protein phosphatase family protein n=1 Tax=Citreicella sp. C3M06 TaxID=2841564 RepID=UPI001C0883A2|nr:dual specificity protein phosphatase [Citreicella sp. C3M06]MBU2961250.1 dual specificity protein phosphatase family protein [Citreicella sp. C3M06]
MHFLPSNTPALERAEDETPLLFAVPDTQTPGLSALWLGNLTAAEDAPALAQAGITGSVNLAMNIFPGPLILPDGTHMRRYQIGMIDGPGNAPQTLAAAVMLIDGLAQCYTAGKPHYPGHRRGGLLVHCRGGRSRSVGVLALWLHWRQRARYPSLDSALDAMRALRGQDDSYPLPPMIALAREVLAQGLLR